MSERIYTNGPVTATLVAGPRRPGGDRSMVQINNGAAFVQVYPDDLAAIAEAVAARRAQDRPGPGQSTIAFCEKCDGWTMFCAPTSHNRVVWTRIAREAGDRIAYVDTDEATDIMQERGACKCGEASP